VEELVKEIRKCLPGCCCLVVAILNIQSENTKKPSVVKMVDDDDDDVIVTSSSPCPVVATLFTRHENGQISCSIGRIQISNETHKPVSISGHFISFFFFSLCFPGIGVLTHKRN
jgi:hypothetical protein